jgi:hypothetical protein
VCVGTGALEGGSVDSGFECERLDIAVAAGWDLAAQQPLHLGKVRPLSRPLTEAHPQASDHLLGTGLEGRYIRGNQTEGQL